MIYYLNEASNYIFGYRWTYNNIGIYEALKKAMGFEKWKEFLKSGVSSWLPHPKEYPSSYRSYFTSAGNKKFKETILPICKEYLDDSKIICNKSEVDKNNIIYQDKYQFFTGGKK